MAIYDIYDDKIEALAIKFVWLDRKWVSCTCAKKYNFKTVQMPVQFM